MIGTGIAALRHGLDAAGFTHTRVVAPDTHSLPQIVQSGMLKPSSPGTHKSGRVEPHNRTRVGLPCITSSSERIGCPHGARVQTDEQTNEQTNEQT